MKKFFLIILLILPVYGFCQTTKIPVDGFLGIKFGTSKEDVKSAIMAMGGVVHPDFKHKDGLSITNVKFGNRLPAFFFVRFINDKAYEAFFIFSPDDLKKGIDDYNDILAYLTETYGEPKTLNVYKSPFSEKNATNPLALVRGGFLQYNSFWLQDTSTTPNGISISMDTDVNTTVEFQDGILKKQAEKIEH